MKTTRIAALIAAAWQFALPLVSVLAQGSLTPPGAPAPTMKSLDQVEARTAITNAASLVTISQPGSYYLTRNLTVSSGDGINITTIGVTLDLNGFTIRSTAASAAGTGILLSGGLRNITIANGFIQGGVTNNGSGVYTGGGFAHGISYSGSSPENVLVSRITVSGCLAHGIFLGTEHPTVVESCTVRTVGNTGIMASTIKGCSAEDIGLAAIAGNHVSDCRGECTGSGNGIAAETAQNCHGSSYGNQNGIAATSALNCFGFSAGGGRGISTFSAKNCFGGSGSGTGIYTYGAENCYGDGGTGIGINASTAQNCYGVNNGSTYAIVTATAQNCYGKNNGSGWGLYAIDTASGCYGFSTSGTGLFAFIANVCRGESTSGTALSATHNVNSF